MKLRKMLSDLARVIADETERNPEFAQKVISALGTSEIPNASAPPAARPPHPANTERRPKNRRAAAVLDPVEIARSGEEMLRARLRGLTVDQLKDIVAEYGMDPGKLVTKWKTADRIIDRIVEIALVRAQKGDAFRAE